MAWSGDPRIHLRPVSRRGMTMLALTRRPGEAAQFDTRVPRWFGAADAEPVEFLSLFGRQGERAHLRARPRTTRPPGAAGSPSR
jgi:hypothetical protein